MKLERWLHDATALLTAHGIGTARLDCLVLLEDQLKQDRALLLAHPEMKISARQLHILDAQLKRRSEHEPLAYIRGKTEFYGRDFYIDHRVLEPRPESEAIIDLLKQLQLPAESPIADIGTGSGMLAITAALELTNAQVIALDIDPDCLAVARYNAQLSHVELAFYCGDLLTPLVDNQLNIAVLLCNLPYVPTDFHINQAAMAEPSKAIFGGSDGLDLYRELFAQIKLLAQQPKHVLTESLPPQHEALTAIAAKYGYKLSRTEDFVQLFEQS